MAKTAEMRLIELMVLKQDISSVIEYIGKKESFQFQKKLEEEKKKIEENERITNKRIEELENKINDLQAYIEALA